MPHPAVTDAAAIIRDPRATLPDKVAAAAELWALSEDCQKVIEEFKTQIRAVAVASGNSSFTVNGTGMTQCRVTVPPPMLKLREDVSVEAHRGNLGEYFGVLFETRTTLRNNLPPGTIDNLPGVVRACVAGITTLVNPTPRVSITVLGGVEEVK